MFECVAVWRWLQECNIAKRDHLWESFTSLVSMLCHRVTCGVPFGDNALHTAETDAETQDRRLTKRLRCIAAIRATPEYRYVLKSRWLRTVLDLDRNAITKQ